MVIHRNTHPVTDGEEQPKQGEEEGTQMNDDRCGRTPDEIVDQARHDYAVGTVALRAMADELSEIALRGDGINRWELKHRHDQLYDLYELLGTHTVFGMRDEPVSDGSAKPSGPTGIPSAMAHPSRSRWGPRVAGAGRRRAMSTAARSRGFPTSLATTTTTRRGPFLADVK